MIWDCWGMAWHGRGKVWDGMFGMERDDWGMVWDGPGMVKGWLGDGLVWYGLGMVWEWSGDGQGIFRGLYGMVWDGMGWYSVERIECLV
jgi:hypothetical protein